MMHTILPLFTTSFIMTSAILVAVGWRLILKKKRDQHRRVMLTAAGFALAFFILYVTRTAISGNLAFGGPDYLRVPYLIFLWMHIVLSTVSAVFGMVTIRLGLKENFDKHRIMGRITAIMWFFTALSGFAVYVLLYVLFPGEVGSIFDAVL